MALRIAIVAAAAAALLAGSTAQASSIVYVRKGAIWRSSPDGRHKTLVRRGPGLFSYLEVTQSDRGNLVAERVFADRPRTRTWVRLRRNGRQAGKPWPTAGTHLDFRYDPVRNLPGLVGPLDPELSPDGRLIAQWNILETLNFRNPNPNPPPGGPLFFVEQSVATLVSRVGRDEDVTGNIPTGELVQPSWYARRGLVLATSGGVGVLKSGIWVIPPGRPLRFWFAHNPQRLYGFFHPAISPRGDVLAVVTDTREPGRAVSNDDELAFLRMTGPPPALPQDVCASIQNPNGRIEDLTWSPDGRSIAWADRRGVWTARMNGCTLARRRLIARGATSPDWGRR
jgi:hypothetical protein